MSIISVKKVSKQFEFYKKAPGLFGAVKNFFVRDVQYARAVREASFEIAEGELVGFLGPNGAGKTTTRRARFNTTKPAIYKKLINNKARGRRCSHGATPRTSNAVVD